MLSNYNEEISNFGIEQIINTKEYSNNTANAFMIPEFIIYKFPFYNPLQKNIYKIGFKISHLYTPNYNHPSIYPGYTIEDIIFQYNMNYKNPNNCSNTLLLKNKKFINEGNNKRSEKIIPYYSGRNDPRKYKKPFIEYSITFPKECINIGGKNYLRYNFNANKHSWIWKIDPRLNIGILTFKIQKDKKINFLHKTNILDIQKEKSVENKEHLIIGTSFQHTLDDKNNYDYKAKYISIMDEEIIFNKSNLTNNFLIGGFYLDWIITFNDDIFFEFEKVKIKNFYLDLVFEKNKQGNIHDNTTGNFDFNEFNYKITTWNVESKKYSNKEKISKKINIKINDNTTYLYDIQKKRNIIVKTNNQNSINKGIKIDLWKMIDFETKINLSIKTFLNYNIFFINNFYNKYKLIGKERKNSLLKPRYSLIKENFKFKKEEIISTSCFSFTKKETRNLYLRNKEINYEKWKQIKNKFQQKCQQ